MRLDFVKIFVDSTALMFRELIGPTVEVPSIAMKPSPVATREVMAIIGLTGDAQGHILERRRRDVPLTERPRLDDAVLAPHRRRVVRKRCHTRT